MGLFTAGVREEDEVNRDAAVVHPDEHGSRVGPTAVGNNIHFPPPVPNRASLCSGAFT